MTHLVARTASSIQTRAVDHSDPAAVVSNQPGVLQVPGGVAIVATLLAVSLATWYWSEGTVSIESITRPEVEWFYWVTVLFSQTLGTALGDWLYLGTRVSHTLLFWIAFILTRPLGATLGDLLDKPLAAGSLHLSRLHASLVLLAFIAASAYSASSPVPRSQRSSGF